MSATGSVPKEGQSLFRFGGRGRHRADHRRGAVAHLDPALRGDLRVRLAHHAARHVQRLGEQREAGSRVPGGSAAAGDRGADRVFELGAQRLGPRAVERGEELQSGTVRRHQSGSVRQGHSDGTVSAMCDMPELRDGPPWAMEEMILRRGRAGRADPGLVRRARGGGVDPRGRAGGDRRLRHVRARGDGRRGADPRRDRPRRVRGVARPAGRRRAASPSRTRPAPPRRSRRMQAAVYDGARTILITAKPGRGARRHRHRDAARRHLVVPHRRLRLAAARADRDRRRRRRRRPARA